MRRVNHFLKQEAESLLAKQQRLVVSALCCRTKTAIMMPDSGDSMCLLLPGSDVTRLMPAVRKLLVWPRFSDQQDAEERNLYLQTVQTLLQQWSQTLVSAEVIAAKDHRMDLILPHMPQLSSWAMTHITSNTMQSLLSSAERIEEIVYLRSEFRCEDLSPGWKVIEKPADGSDTPDTLFLDALSHHQTEWEQQHKQPDSG